METEKLILIQHYDKFVEYIYQPLINTNRKHKILRDMALQSIVGQYKLFYKAIKSNQVSKLYEADAGIAEIRSLLDLLSHRNGDRRAITRRQQSVAEILLSECGNIIGSMINKRNKSKNKK